MIMAAKNETPPQWARELMDRLDRIEQAPIPQLKEAQKRAAADAIWYAAKAIADEPDDAKRAAALLAADHEVKRKVWDHLCSDPAAAYATAKALPQAHRAAVVAMAPQSLQADMLVEALPAPRRVRLTLRPGVSSWSSSAIPGERPQDRYPGVKLSDGRTTEPGASEKIYTRTALDRMLEIDDELRDGIDRGVVVVENVSEQESRRLLALEIAQLSPNEKPSIAW